MSPFLPWAIDLREVEQLGRQRIQPVQTGMRSGGSRVTTFAKELARMYATQPQ